MCSACFFGMSWGRIIKILIEIQFTSSLVTSSLIFFIIKITEVKKPDFCLSITGLLQSAETRCNTSPNKLLGFLRCSQVASSMRMPRFTHGNGHHVQGFFIEQTVLFVPQTHDDGQERGTTQLISPDKFGCWRIGNWGESRVQWQWQEALREAVAAWEPCTRFPQLKL